MPRAAKNAVSTHARFDRELKRLRADSLDRNPVLANALAFCSNDYLGLARNPALIEAAVEALRSADRVASTGPRLLSGNAAEWESLEEEFAEFVSTEAALYFGSGYAANVGLLSAVPRPEDTIYSDALNHASLIDGIRLSRSRKVVFPHLDLDFLETALARDGDRGEKFIVVESLFSMEGDRAPMDELGRACRTLRRRPDRRRSACGRCPWTRRERSDPIRAAVFGSSWLPRSTPAERRWHRQALS